jgi:hypothetical protein
MRRVWSPASWMMVTRWVLAFFNAGSDILELHPGSAYLPVGGGAPPAQLVRRAGGGSPQRRLRHAGPGGNSR